MVVVLSRASRALEQNLLSARHESMLAKVICDEVQLIELIAHSSTVIFLSTAEALAHEIGLIWWVKGKGAILHWSVGGVLISLS